MRSKLAYLLLIVLLAWGASCSAEDELPQNVESVEVGSCVDTTSRAALTTDEYLEAESQGEGTALVIHHNVQFNCCIEDVKLGVAISGNQITITESEVTPEPCRCICPFDLKIKLKDLETGDYTVVIGSLTTSLTIE